MMRNLVGWWQWAVAKSPPTKEVPSNPHKIDTSKYSNRTKVGEKQTFNTGGTILHT